MPASYPSLPIDYSSTMGYLDALTTERASNGVLRGRSFYPTVKRPFHLVHTMITTAQRDTLMAFYATNRTLPVSLFWPHDGLTYTVQFTGVPKCKQTRPGGLLDLEVDLAEA